MIRSKIILFIFMSLNALYAYAQTNSSKIFGIVRSYSYQTIDHAEIFISGTTLGTTSDKNGYYEIKDIPSGKNTIIVSMAGYESQTREIYIFSGREREENFTLNEKVYNLNPVEVTASSPEKWKDQLETFKEYFLGVTPNADKCVIENEVEINFYEDDKIFSASFPDELEITNYALGYKIKCIVKSFGYEKDSKTFYYKVFPMFKDIAEPEGSKKWYEQMRRRKGAYLGSLRRVITDIIENKLPSKTLKLTLWENPKWPICHQVDEVSDIISYNSFTNTYTLEFTEYLKIEIENNLEAVRTSWLYLPNGKAEIDIYGNFINTDEFIIRGGLAKKGVADMLPKYYEIEK